MKNDDTDKLKSESKCLTEYNKWMLLLSWLDSDNEDMFEDELVEIIAK